MKQWVRDVHVCSYSAFAFADESGGRFDGQFVLAVMALYLQGARLQASPESWFGSLCFCGEFSQVECKYLSGQVPKVNYRRRASVVVSSRAETPRLGASFVRCRS
jgi:hypothetical protein